LAVGTADDDNESAATRALRPLALLPRRAPENDGVEDQGTVNDLQDTGLLDIDADALREAEKVFAQGILDTMAGKEVSKATYEDTRVVVIMSDGSEYYFYGFMGESRP
jgi:hypothetical protein